MIDDMVVVDGYEFEFLDPKEYKLLSLLFLNSQDLEDLHITHDPVLSFSDGDSQGVEEQEWNGDRESLVRLFYSLYGGTTVNLHASKATMGDLILINCFYTALIQAQEKTQHGYTDWGFLTVFAHDNEEISKYIEDCVAFGSCFIRDGIEFMEGQGLVVNQETFGILSKMTLKIPQVMLLGSLSVVYGTEINEDGEEQYLATSSLINHNLQQASCESLTWALNNFASGIEGLKRDKVEHKEVSSRICSRSDIESVSRSFDSLLNEDGKTTLDRVCNLYLEMRFKGERDG